MPGYNALNNLAHDMSMQVADATTTDLLDAMHDARETYVEAKKAFDQAFNAAYDKAYARLEKQYAT